ncbi:GUN4 domain-containing protein [Geminocystis sp. NIES-3709]|uniref:GUN4 domain-containing protein n=1 Tax=Geminocystis sp. NIES-3709 TaxID=1617448 RepID=UPI0005FCB20E|nr:GUN4 domain-containing protein [Geminocystis sp. NIES-3709]BAQ63878.1 serine/threonine kinase [Geminocystis sp. NIES-3709]
MTDTDTRLTELETKVTELTNLVNQLQGQIILLPDVVRYGKLQQLLQEGDIRSADEETTKIILEVAGKQRDNLTPDDVAKYPCNSLSVIDALWKKYSEEKFGFSIQLKTYYQVGGNIDTLRTQDTKILVEFADSVGWLNEKKQARFEEYDSWNFSLSAPDGCFPAHWWKSPYGLKMVTFFFSRLISCNLA